MQLELSSCPHDECNSYCLHSLALFWTPPAPEKNSWLSTILMLQPCRSVVWCCSGSIQGFHFELSCSKRPPKCSGTKTMSYKVLKHSLELGGTAEIFTVQLKIKWTIPILLIVLFKVLLVIQVPV